MAPYQITVSDLHLAQRCPRLLAAKLAGQRVAFHGFEGGVFYGSLFHDKVVGPFHRDIAGETANKSLSKSKTTTKTTDGQQKRNKFIAVLDHSQCRTEIGLSEQLKGFFLLEYFIPFFEKESKKLSEAQCESLAKAVDHWMTSLANFLFPILETNRTSANRAPLDILLAGIFLPPERSMTATYTFSDKKTLKITGRCDTVLCNPFAGTLEIVEFKCRKATDPVEDLAQVALYAWLAKKNTGIETSASVYNFDDTPVEQCYDSSMLRKIAEQNLPLLFEQVRIVLDGNVPPTKTTDNRLCVSCPNRNSCHIAMDTVPATTAAPISDGVSVEGQHRMSQLIAALDRFGLKAVPHTPPFIFGPRILRLMLRPNLGGSTTIAKFQNKAEDLKVLLELSSPPLILTQAGYLSVDIPRAETDKTVLGDLFRLGAHNKPISDISFPLGLSIEGETHWVDLADSNSTSILIGGTAGSGKSVLLQSIVLGILRSSPPKSVLLTLIDPKRVTFQSFRELSSLRDNRIIMDAAEAVETLSDLSREMEERYELLAAERLENIRDYNERYPDRKLLRHVVIIDEFADLQSDKSQAKQLSIAVQQLCQKGRAAGFHFLLATQRPDNTVVSNQVRANLQMKIALKVTSDKNSKIILGDSGAECLMGYGDMLIGGAVAPKRLQSALFSHDDIAPFLVKVAAG